MGAAQSYVTSEAAVTVVLVAGAIGFGYTQVSHGSSSTSSTSHSPAGGNVAGKKGKKKKGPDALPSELAPTAILPRPAPPTAIPGGFDTPAVDTPTPAVVDIPPPKNKKSKKKKKGKAVSASTTSGPTAPDVASTAGYHSDSSAEHQQPKAKRPQKSSPSSSQLTRTPALPSTISIDTDGSWTRVGSSRRKQNTVSAGMVSTSDGPSGPSADPTSDAVTTSVTGNSSPVAERTEDEGLAYNPRVPETRRPLAERLLPKPRKTGVDDMLEKPDYPTVSRVMRVQPSSDEKPASGFSWEDYEDVHTGENAGEGNEADGEDDGWGVVQSKKSRSRAERPVSSQIPAQKAPETLTKRQRQNASKREVQKAAKSEAETERLAILAKHKRELEQVRMSEQFGGKGGKSKTASGGMKASVDEGGKLVWE